MAAVSKLNFHLAEKFLSTLWIEISFLSKPLIIKVENDKIITNVYG